MRLLIRTPLFLLFGLLLVISPLIAAQEACEPFTEEIKQALQEACADVEAGYICTVEEDPAPLEEGEITAPALIHFPSNGLSAVLIGDAILNVSMAEAPQITLNAANAMGYNVNLRSGPGPNFDQAGIFSYDDAAVADGRDASGEWIRLQATEGTVWISKSLVSLDGDVVTLPIVDASSSAGGSALALELLPGDESCMGSGLLLSSDSAAIMQINDLILQLEEALVFVENRENELQITHLSGVLNIRSGESTTESRSGDVIRAADEVEVEEDMYPFSLLINLPLELITETPLSCTTGILPDSEEIFSLAQPEADAENAFALSSDTHYSINQQSADELWWQISHGEESGWVSKDAVEAIGDCDSVPVENLVQNTAAPISAVPTGDPADTIYGYLQARVESDTARMQALSCATWDSQAMIQSQSFRAMNAELQNVSCTTSSQNNTSAVVTCSGHILTLYNNETREWPLGSYSIVAENGEWRMCGES